jgi:hypothetical protein
MRHLRDLASIEVPLVARGVICTTSLRLLIAATRRPHRLASRNCRASPRAVPMTIVAPGAQKEDLAAPSAGHESKGLDVRVGPIL